MQQVGWVLAALGVSETGLSIMGAKSWAMPLAEPDYQALAQPSARKLALLVGINQYPRIAPLGGCVTDVELQRELLIHRFGFNPSDILALTDQQATRENIENAFMEHLCQQAREGDVVVFHFSGYGSCVVSTAENSPLQNSLVPVDGIGLTQPTGNYLLEETLFLLLRSLKTHQVTTILDTSYIDTGTAIPSHLRIRSCPEISAEQISADELAFQEKLTQKFGISRSQIKNFQMPGIVLQASAPTQTATEAPWGGFSAGLFTYALTQNLWQSTDKTTIQMTLNRAAVVVEQLAGKEQQPQLSGEKSQEKSLLGYNLNPDTTTGADGFVIAVEDSGKTAQLWLAGLPTRVLPYYGVNSLLTLLVSPATDANSKPLQLQIRTRDGLTARARIIGADTLETAKLQVGQLVQESVRVLPRHLGLTVALDSRLDRIERVDATSAFASVGCVSSVVTTGEQPADYVFGKGQGKSQKEEAPNIDPTVTPTSKPIETGYGLFLLGGEPIFNTIGEASEAVKSAVNRLTYKLRTLLAVKLWRLSVNDTSSSLGVMATLEMISPQEQVLMQRKTLRSPFITQGAINQQPEQPGIPTLPIGSRIQFRVQNYSSSPVYFILLGIDSSSGALAFYPLVSAPESDTSEVKSLLKDTIIAPGETLTIPRPAASYEWFIQGVSGLAEVFVICSRAPFTQTIAALAAMSLKGERERIGDLFNPLDVAQAVLQDLHQASGIVPEIIGTSSDIYALDVNAWATLSFVYQVG